jgi:hypothetical protein
MGNSTWLVIGALLLAGLAWYSQTSMRNKIQVLFIRPNKTLVSRLVKLSAKYVIIDGYKYSIDPKRIMLRWVATGINQLFPTWLPTVIVKWDTDVPLDPETFENTWRDGDMMNMASSQEDYRDFAKGMESQVGGKKGILDKYLALIVIAGFIILGFVLYKVMGDQASIGNQISQMHQILNQQQVK